MPCVAFVPSRRMTPYATALSDPLDVLNICPPLPRFPMALPLEAWDEESMNPELLQIVDERGRTAPFVYNRSSSS